MGTVIALLQDDCEILSLQLVLGAVSLHQAHFLLVVSSQLLESEMVKNTSLYFLKMTALPVGSRIQRIYNITI